MFSYCSWIRCYTTVMPFFCFTSLLLWWFMWGEKVQLLLVDFIVITLLMLLLLLLSSFVVIFTSLASSLLLLSHLTLVSLNFYVTFLIYMLFCYMHNFYFYYDNFNVCFILLLLLLLLIFSVCCNDSCAKTRRTSSASRCRCSNWSRNATSRFILRSFARCAPVNVPGSGNTYPYSMIYVNRSFSCEVNAGLRYDGGDGGANWSN